MFNSQYTNEISVRDFVYLTEMKITHMIRYQPDSQPQNRRLYTLMISSIKVRPGLLTRT